jgi:ADP-ribose pyrophosphatase YjhB (NUDIX family)
MLHSLAIIWTPTKVRTMKAQYQEKFFWDENETQGTIKTIELPFSRISARAVILRKSDGAVLGVLHRPDGKFAPPGGGIKHGETPSLAVIRELEEEEIQLIDVAEGWENHIETSYYASYQELSIWFLLLVEDVRVGDSKEIVQAQWISQTEDIWYPGMRERIAIMIQKYLPSFSRITLDVKPNPFPG